MPIPRIRHLAIRCRDVEQSIRFYRDALGFQVIGPREPGGPSTDLTDQTLNITILPFVGMPGDPPEEGNEHIHFGIIVPNATELYYRVRAHGISIVRDDIKARGEPQNETAPVGSYKIADPDGNIIDVSDNPAEWRGVSATV